MSRYILPVLTGGGRGGKGLFCRFAFVALAVLFFKIGAGGGVVFSATHCLNRLIASQPKVVVRGSDSVAARCCECQPEQLHLYL